MKKLFIILVFATCHFVLSLVALFATVGASMSRFDTGDSQSASETVIALVAAVLHFPIILMIQPFSVSFSSWAEYLLFVLNSLLWGTGIYYMVVYIKRRLGKRVDRVEIPASQT